ncbi:uncharacterized protein LOC112577191 isoform X2 [Pomacea canaliculata]|uniref:uncharacterized protein LOC112577191 isoform X2 n=1 Tax=Pomacea canaliculata TaxID=400727 RepID=UPI000D73D28C|nr:uncharacterized protein LOC112577191 isoform X2 [Pomacea canaliculata]
MMSDLIFVLGNQDLRTADHAADLYLSGFAPLVVVSGKHGHGTAGKWELPEAVVFSNRLLEKNVPASAIIIEPEATNTGENIIFTQKLLRNLPSPLDPHSIILVQTPFMGRRTYATFMKQWERAELVDVRVTSPPISLADYACDHSAFRSQAKLVEEMLRNMQRMLEYPLLGFQIKQEIPRKVMEAYQSLQLHFDHI